MTNVSKSGFPTLSALGLSTEQVSEIAEITNASKGGIIVICGLTGSGKTTLFEAISNHVIVKDVNANYLLLEESPDSSSDEIEGAIRWAVNDGVQFLGVDGGIRDKETLLAALEAADGEGVLVLITAHSKPENIKDRMIKMLAATEPGKYADKMNALVDRTLIGAIETTLKRDENKYITQHVSIALSNRA